MPIIHTRMDINIDADFDISNAIYKASLFFKSFFLWHWTQKNDLQKPPVRLNTMNSNNNKKVGN